MDNNTNSTLVQRYTRLLGCPKPVARWLIAFRDALRGGTEAIERSIRCNGLAVEDPGACACGSEVNDDPFLAWFHSHHRLYNRAMKRLIKDTTGLTAFHAILEQDLAVEDSDLGPEWGNLLRKDYAREVLVHFVDSDDWC